MVRESSETVLVMKIDLGTELCVLGRGICWPAVRGGGGELPVSDQ